MPLHYFPEPAPMIAELDGYPGPIQVLAVDPETGACVARRIERDEVTGGIDTTDWDTVLLAADLDRLATMSAVPPAGPAEPPEEFDETHAFGSDPAMTALLMGGTAAGTAAT